MFFVGVIQVMVGEKLKTKFEIFGSGDPRRDGGAIRNHFNISTQFSTFNCI